MVSQKKLGVGIIIQNQDDDFLLHLRDEDTNNMPNQWSLIGGGVDLGESPEDAAIREVKEETNFLVNNITIFTKITFNSEWDAIIFYARVDSNKQKMVLSEGAELRFFPKKDVLTFINNLSYSNPFLEAFRKYLSN